MQTFLHVMIICYNENIRGVAQPGSVLAWGASGRKFESSRPDQIIKNLRRFIEWRFFFCGE